MTDRPIIAVTMGDPAGIGPEISLKASLEPHVRSRCRPIIVGSLGLLEAVADALRIPCRLRPFSKGRNMESSAREGVDVVEVIDLANCMPGEFEMGQVSRLCGRAAADYIEKAVELAMEGAVSAIVTAPIHKESINLAGVDAPGHTEMLARLTRTEEYAMMLVAGGLRVSHVTTHLALKDVPARISVERVFTVIKLTHDAVASAGIASPRIAVAGLNPHCGEHGLFGDEDHEQILPAVQKAQRNGLQVDGPIPADTVFVKAAAGQYDAVVAMYHDQGHIPVKLAGFKVDPASGAWWAVTGVNVTLGLPIIRTSVDHGVAFDIAGKGIASWQSMVDAIELAVDMAHQKTS